MSESAWLPVLEDQGNQWSENLSISKKKNSLIGGFKLSKSGNRNHVSFWGLVNNARIPNAKFKWNVFRIKNKNKTTARKYRRQICLINQVKAEIVITIKIRFIVQPYFRARATGKETQQSRNIYTGVEFSACLNVENILHACMCTLVHLPSVLLSIKLILCKLQTLPLSLNDIN